MPDPALPRGRIARFNANRAGFLARGVLLPTPSRTEAQWLKDSFPRSAISFQLTSVADRWPLAAVFMGFSFRSQLRGSGGFAPPSLAESRKKIQPLLLKPPAFSQSSFFSLAADRWRL